MTDDAGAVAAYEQVVAVQPSDLDDLGHVNNVVYVRWVMDAATAHWTQLSTPAMRAGVAWVVVRHEIDYLAAAMPGDAVTVRTRVGLRDGITYERLTELSRVGDGKPLARSRTLWAPVDPATGRVKRIPAEVRALVSTNA
ncbi:MAG TPA: thioesterase family protein [Gemmatimonadaceae bacterium]